jgi:hypothetical protein
MTKKISDTKPVVDFVEVAREYCQLIDDRDQKTAIQLLQAIFVYLPRLCLYGLGLPEIKRSLDYDLPQRSQEEWQNLYKSLQNKLEGYDVYFEVFDPYDDKDHESISQTVSDDLSDIYFDLKSGLKEWSRASVAEQRSIIWDWKFGFASHWGHHATGAFRTLFSLLFEHIEGKSELYIGIKETEDGGSGLKSR